MFQQKGNLVANVWKDKRLVYVMSMNTKEDDRTVCQRKEKNGTMSSISIPMNTFYIISTWVAWTWLTSSDVIINES